MHTLIHRALSPQTISYAWLVLTVALTFALAVAQSAIAAVPSLSAAGVPAPHVALTGPASAPTSDAAQCRAAAPTDDRRAWHDRMPRRRRARCATRARRIRRPGRGRSAILTPATPHRSADALAALYGGAGPHGPPASAAHPDELPGRCTALSRPASTSTSA